MILGYVRAQTLPAQSYDSYIAWLQVLYVVGERALDVSLLETYSIYDVLIKFWYLT